MNKLKIFVSLWACLILNADPGYTQESQDAGPITIVIHGGAGTMKKENMSPDQEKAYRDKITQALNIGYQILENGGSALDAVIYSIVILENSPLFNAGKGAVFTHSGQNELDASIMDGRDLAAGAVTGVSTIKNPIIAARAVMEQSDHVMLSGRGAEEFCKNAGLEIVDPSYFYTEWRYESLRKAIEQEEDGSGRIPVTEDHKYGTVGVVALDAMGNLAAGTSTGGMTNKKYGRIGDSPIIGAGTYADNHSCAVSSTGHGEYFIRGVIAYDIAARVKYLDMDVAQAAKSVIHGQLSEMGGTGGVICLDRQGNFAMEFNTEGMYRGVMQKGKKLQVYIF